MIVGLCLAVMGGAAEWMAREALAEQIRKDPGLVGADTTVRQHDGWALAALTGERLEQVDIVADNATLGPFKGVSVQVEVFGLRLGPVASPWCRWTTGRPGEKVSPAPARPGPRSDGRG
ncbi:hypothetical protein SUDANB105_06908 [Streptomyces sp. enrichment culture]